MTLPHNEEIEKGILAACLQDKGKINDLIESKVSPDHFHNLKNKLLWSVIPKILQARGNVDEIIVMEWMGEHTLRGSAIMDSISRQERDMKMISFVTQDYLTTISGIESTANFPAWLGILNEQYLARQYAHRLNDHYLAVCEQPSTASEKIEEMANWIINHNSRDDVTLKSSAELAEPAYELAEKIRKKEIPAGIPFGLSDIDRLCSMRPGSMTILAARPSMGKSAFALTVAYHNAKNGIPVMYFSLEMENDDMELRLFAVHGKINIKEYLEGRSLRTPEYLKKVANEAAKLPVFFEEAAPNNISRIRATSRRMKMRHNIGLIVIDYLQLTDAPNPRLTREQQISEISRNIKLMSKELGIPVLALAQLNREVERREPPRPRLSDLRDSGSLEQDADIVMFLSPDSKNADNKYMPGGKMICEIAKHRGGSLNAVPVSFVTKCTRFEDYTTS